MEVDPVLPTYTQDEILNMKPDLVPVFLSYLGLPSGPNERQRILTGLGSRGMIRGQMFEPFADLPAELQVEVMRRTSPTAREGTLVSRGMKEIADVALMENVRNNDLVDPSIGMSDRKMYFKVNTVGIGEYFSPEPAFWQLLKYYRQNYDAIHTKIYIRMSERSDIVKYIKDYQMYLVYGPFLSTTSGSIKFASLALLKSSKLFRDSSSGNVTLRLNMVSYLYINDANVKENDFILTFQLGSYTPSTSTVLHKSVYDIFSNPKVCLNRVLSMELIYPVLINYATGEKRDESEYPKTECRIIPLGPQGFRDNTIFPSLQPDVWAF